MVWALFHIDPISGEDKYYIFARGTYKVGRKGCDVIINKDKGVSRIHAEIAVDAPNSLNPLNKRPFNTLSKVRIRDCSKYGTFINRNLGQKEKVHELPNKETTLEDGDLVSFGTGNATYRKFCFSSKRRPDNNYEFHCMIKCLSPCGPNATGKGTLNVIPSYPTFHVIVHRFGYLTSLNSIAA